MIIVLKKMNIAISMKRWEAIFWGTIGFAVGGFLSAFFIFPVPVLEIIVKITLIFAIIGGVVIFYRTRHSS